MSGMYMSGCVFVCMNVGMFVCGVYMNVDVFMCIGVGVCVYECGCVCGGVVCVCFRVHACRCTHHRYHSICV